MGGKGARKPERGEVNKKSMRDVMRGKQKVGEGGPEQGSLILGLKKDRKALLRKL